MSFRLACVVPVIVFLVFASVVHGRIWTNRSGEFAIEAELLGTSKGKVQLKKANGDGITVPIEKLSDADQAYLKQLPQAKEPATILESPPEAQADALSAPAEPNEKPASRPPSSSSSEPKANRLHVGVIATKTDNAQKMTALLELQLSQRASTVLVERGEIDKVLGEQQLQAVLAADAPGKQAALGKMLKADLLIFLADSQRPKPHLTLVVCETGRGLRLCAEPVFLTNQIEADVAALLKKVEAAAKRGQEKITDIVAVPPLVNHSLTQEADNLQAGIACLVEQDLLYRPGLLVVELAEAKALVQEMVVSGSPSISRQLPLYLLGEYRVEEMREKRRGEFNWRLLRGEKELGRRKGQDIFWPDFSERIRQAATELIDETAGKGVLPGNPLAEAKHLAEREQMFVTIGQWQQSLALAEASLLLNPDQPAMHGDALRAQLEIIADKDWMQRDSRRAFQTLRTALPHLEAYFCGTKVPYADRYYSDPLKWGTVFSFAPGVREDYYVLLNDMRDTADRILTAKAEAKVWDESLAFLAEWDTKSRSWGLFDQTRASAARTAWFAKDLPYICEHRLKLLRGFSWMGGQRNYNLGDRALHGYYPYYYGLVNLPGMDRLLEDTPYFDPTYLSQPELHRHYLDFFSKVKKMPDPRLQELADRFTERFHRLPELRKEAEAKAEEAKKKFAQTARPSLPTPAPVENPEVLFHRLSLRRILPNGNDQVVERPRSDDHSTPLLGKWIPLYEGCDLICLHYDELTLMKEKGRLRVLPLKIATSNPVMKNGVGQGWHLRTFDNVCWDGRYLWALNPGDNGPLAVIEPREEKIWRAGPSIGLPPSISCVIAPLGEGKVCIAGYFGRLWLALASFDTANGIKLEVIHEAREVLDLPHTGPGLAPEVTSPKLAFPVLCAATVTAPAVDGSAARQRVIISRCANSPLFVDPETRSVIAAADYYMSDCFSLRDEGVIYWNDNRTRQTPEGNVGALYRVGFPDFKREVVSSACLEGRQFFFQGRFHMTSHAMDPTGKDTYAVASSPEGPLRILRCEFPGRWSVLSLSNHYGLVVSLFSSIYQVEPRLD